MRKILEACPTCGGPLTITEVRCERCATEVRSQYEPCPFCRLAPEQMNFMLLFVQNRGNLSEMEKALGVSYPTIRGKLEEIIRIVMANPPGVAVGGAGAGVGGAHGGVPVPAAPLPPPAVGTGAPPWAPPTPAPAPPTSDRRRDILARVAAGQMSAAEGLAALRDAEPE